MILRKISNRVKKFQMGVTVIPHSEFEEKVFDYRDRYEAEHPSEFTTNIRKRRDLAFLSHCKDRVVEDYLKSQRFHFENIGIILDPYAYAPQSAVLLMYFQQKASVKIKLVSGQKNAVYEDHSSLKNYHRISVTGMEKGSNKISLSVMDENGKILKSRRIHIYLDKVKEMPEYPMVETNYSGESGFSRIFITGGDVTPFVFNSNGTLFHQFRFRDYRTSTYGVYPYNSHNFLWPIRNIGAPSYANPHSCLLYDMDFMGRITRTYHVKHGIHHFVYEMPNGNLVTFSSSVENYTDKIKEGHTEDIIIELERETGKIVRTIYLKDILGTNYVDMVDWVHGNALEYNEAEDSMLVCMRNVHTVFKMNWTTTELTWILSLPSLWENTSVADKVLKPIGDVYYSFQAHAAYEVKDFNGAKGGNRYYLVFDNHRLNRRPIEGFEEDGHSYINIYAVNEREGTVAQEKHMQIDMSIVRSNARYDGKSNHIFNMSGCLTRDYEEFRGKVEEYDYDTEKVLNTWYIKDDFFSGYDFQWKSDDYCKPLSEQVSGSYFVGEAQQLSSGSVTWEKAKEDIDELYFSKPFMEEKFLYFYTKDHTIDYLVLEGEHNVYQCDYTKTWQTLQIHAGRSYYCVVSLENLPKDNYQLKVVHDNLIYNTEFYINVGEKEHE